MDDRGARSKHRLRPEKSQSVARRQGFDSLHLHDIACGVTARAGSAFRPGRDHLVAEAFEEFGCPWDCVRGSDPGRLGTDPELEVRGPIVVFDAVAVWTVSFGSSRR